MNLGGLLAQRKLEDRTEFQGLQISIENKTGSVRQGTDPNTGKPWRTVMKYPYGYIRLTEGVDGDHLDCFVGPDKNASHAYVVHQVNPETGKYDEDKCMLGFSSAAEAKAAYLQHYDDPKYFGTMEAVPMEKFREKALATKDRPAKIAAAFKMEASMALEAGGPGSGCRGENCGRPSSGLSPHERLERQRSHKSLQHQDSVKNFIKVVKEKHPDVVKLRMNPDKARIAESAPAQLVDPKSLVTSQPNVDRPVVKHFLDNPDDINSKITNWTWGTREGSRKQYVVVAKTNDGTYVVDGNHRAAAALLLGKQLRARVVDLTHVEGAAETVYEIGDQVAVDGLHTPYMVSKIDGDYLTLVGQDKKTHVIVRHKRAVHKI